MHAPMDGTIAPLQNIISITIMLTVLSSSGTELADFGFPMKLQFDGIERESAKAVLASFRKLEAMSGCTILSDSSEDELVVGRGVFFGPTLARAVFELAE